MNKKLLVFGVLGVFALALVSAGLYLVQSITIQSDVYEPFSNIEYAIIGDSGNWEGEYCSSIDEGMWKTYEHEEVLEVGGLFAGEGRKVCVRFDNLGAGDIDYTISNTISAVNTENTSLCSEAFGENSISGTALGKQKTFNGYGITVDDGADPVDDCLITIDVQRGSEDLE